MFKTKMKVPDVNETYCVEKDDIRIKSGNVSRSHAVEAVNAGDALSRAGPAHRSLRRHPQSRSFKSSKTKNDLDMELKILESLEKNNAEKLSVLLKRKDMSEQEHNRKRDQLKRLLQPAEQEIQELERERNQALKDLKNVESAYSDVQEKYERVMKTLLALKKREDLLIERDNANMQKIKEMDERLEKFKDEAYEQVEKEYQSWLSKLAEAESTNLKLKAMIRKAEMKVEKLEHELSQKDKQNNELHSLCDELIHNSGRTA